MSAKKDIRQRGPVWTADFWHNGKRVRDSFGKCTEEEARIKCAELKLKLLKTAASDAPRIVRASWFEAKIKWINAAARAESEIYSLQLFDGVFPDRPLEKCTSEAIEQALEQLSARRQWSPDTYNRNLARLVAIANLSDLKLKIKKKPTGPARTRVLDESEWEALKRELPPHMLPMVIFSAFIGMRQSNVLALRWDHVDLARQMVWVDAKDAKERKDLAFPLSAEALAVLQEQRRVQDISRMTPQELPVSEAAKVLGVSIPVVYRMARRGMISLRTHGVLRGKNPQTVDLSQLPRCEWVFPYFGRPISNVNNAWHLAMERAGLGHYKRWTTPDGKAHEEWQGDVTWHTLRHTFASWHRVAGTPLENIQALGGWKDPRSVARYARMNVEYLRGAAQNIKPWSRGSVVTFPALVKNGETA